MSHVMGAVAMLAMMRQVTLPLWVVIVVCLSAVILAILLWSVKRRTRTKLTLEDEEGGIPELLQSIVGITQGTLVEGNKIELLRNGDAFFPALFQAMEEAKESIHFETFLCKEGEITRRVADVLAKKAKEGVEIRFLADGSGGKKFGKKAMKQMRDAGCCVAAYHPLRISNLGRMNNRDHRKIVVVDGRIGFIGGHCLTDDWLGDAQDKKHFRDLSARVEGPVVQQLQSAFSENWIEETGDVPAGECYFPKLEPRGEVKAHAVFVSPSGTPSMVKLLHYLLIHSAKKQLRIQNPYFLPDPDGRKALLDAAKRGVDVRVMIPAVTATDAPIVQHASHHHYGTMLKGGVRIFEYQKTLLHQKVMTVDGCYSTIGSTNFDDRSFELNDEVALGIYDEGVARELEQMFEDDLQHCREVHLEPWAKRPWRHKLLDFGMFLFNEQL